MNKLSFFIISILVGSFAGAMDNPRAQENARLREAKRLRQQRHDEQENQRLNALQIHKTQELLFEAIIALRNPDRASKRALQVARGVRELVANDEAAQGGGSAAGAAPVATAAPAPVLAHAPAAPLAPRAPQPGCMGRIATWIGNYPARCVAAAALACYAASYGYEWIEQARVCPDHTWGQSVCAGINACPQNNEMVGSLCTAAVNACAKYIAEAPSYKFWC